MKIILQFIGLMCILMTARTVFAAVDLSSPEATVSGYIECLKTGDLAGIKARYYPETIEYTLRGRSAIEEHVIAKKVVFTEKEVDSWNRSRSRTQAKSGDVLLEVRETIRGTAWLFSYVLRSFDGNWKLISHSGWCVD